MSDPRSSSRQHIDKARSDIRKIFLHALSHVDAGRLVGEHVRLEGESLLAGAGTVHLGCRSRIFVGGIGKAAAHMALSLEEILRERISDGLVIVKQGQTDRPRRVEVREAGHPDPDKRGLRATEELIGKLGGYGEGDLVIFLISGGGSSLFVMPADGLTLEDKILTNRVLLASGARIEEINSVRRYLSRVKGGKLLPTIYPASLINVVLSDVIGDDLEIIASGPTIQPFRDLPGPMEVVEEYNLGDTLPAAVLERLKAAHTGECPDQSEESSGNLPDIRNVLVGNNSLLLEHAVAKAQSLGYATHVIAPQLEGSAEEEAKLFVSTAIGVREGKGPVKPPACLIGGGETTVAVRGDGVGGRCQEFALAAALSVEKKMIVALAAGSDGADGPTEAAGAIVDGETCQRGREMGLDPRDHLERNDSNTFFRGTGDLIETGPTGTNVNDLYTCIVP